MPKLIHALVLALSTVGSVAAAQPALDMSLLHLAKSNVPPSANSATVSGESDMTQPGTTAEPGIAPVRCTPVERDGKHYKSCNGQWYHWTGRSWVPATAPQ